jgi:hypothetical protein
MDLKQVVAELRTELESVNQVITAMEKLAELRSRRSAELTPIDSEAPTRRRIRKPTPSRESAAAASGDS